MLKNRSFAAIWVDHAAIHAGRVKNILIVTIPIHDDDTAIATEVCHLIQRGLGCCADIVAREFSARADRLRDADTDEILAVACG